MNAREALTKYLDECGLNPKEYAELKGVSPAAVYKFLAGRDIRLSTWEKIRPPISSPLPGGRRKDDPATRSTERRTRPDRRG